MVYRRKRSKSRSRSRSKKSRRRNPARKRTRARARRPWNKGKKFTNYKRVKSHRRRVNPRRRRSVRRRNPSFLPNKAFAMQALGIVGGFVGGKFAASFYDRLPIPAVAAPYAPGLLNLVLGYFVSQQRKIPMSRDLGIGIAAAGAASLLSRFVSLPGLGVDLSGGDEQMIRVGDDVVRVGADLSGYDEEVFGGSSVYEMV